MQEEQTDIVDDTTDTTTEQSTDAQDTAAAGADVLDSTDQNEAQSDAGGDVLSDDDATGDEGVPDQYTFDAPEGVELDEARLEVFKEKAKELGFSQKQFQQILEYDLERSQAAQQEAVSAWNERVDGWRQAAKADKEFGGEAYESNVKVAKSAIDKFADAELKALLKSPSEDNPEGLAIGNHPAMLRFLHRVGKMLADPELILGEDVQKSDGTEAKLRRLYPSMFEKDSA